MTMYGITKDAKVVAMARLMSVRVPDETQEKLKRIARQMGLTRNGLVQVIFSTWLKAQEQQKGEKTNG